jgi:hypothetical protein
MSHIPNSAMPHAGDTATQPVANAEPASDQTLATSLKERAGKLADTARANPKMAAAAGAAVVAGVAAAAAIPLMRGRSSSSGNSKSSNASKKS